MKPSSKNILEKLEDQVQKATESTVASWRGILASTKTAPAKDARVVPATIADALETIVKNSHGNKYIFSILLTSCIKKLLTPKQDVRIAQENMPGGYSNRSLDQREITPFLKHFGYTHCEASGLESGRNLERPLPWDLQYACNPRGKGNREAFLGVLNYIETQKGNPGLVAAYLLWLDRSHKKVTPKTVAAPLEARIEDIMRILTTHFKESSGQGRSRLPVLALYAIYSELIDQLSRYKGMTLLPLEKHTTADLRSHSIGDIQVNKSSSPFEGVEVKSDKSITAAMINELPRKFGGKAVSRYYILTTSPTCVLPEDETSVKKAIESVGRQTGCQVIANGLIRTLWYYLRLLEDPAPALSKYQKLLESDPDIRPDLKSCWNRIAEKEKASGTLAAYEIPKSKQQT